LLAQILVRVADCHLLDSTDHWLVDVRSRWQTVELWQSAKGKDVVEAERHIRRHVRRSVIGDRLDAGVALYPLLVGVAVVVVAIDEPGPINCQFDLLKVFSTAIFTVGQWKCASNRSSFIELYFGNRSSRVRTGEQLQRQDTSQTPEVHLNTDYVLALSFTSFLLLMVGIQSQKKWTGDLNVHWIRYISHVHNEERDICRYGAYPLAMHLCEVFVLLYATHFDSSYIKWQTICHTSKNQFHLSKYIDDFQLKLIGATHYFLTPCLDKETQVSPVGGE
jgi:hypothetical protein